MQYVTVPNLDHYHSHSWCSCAESEFFPYIFVIIGHFTWREAFMLPGLCFTPDIGAELDWKGYSSEDDYRFQQITS